MNALAEPTAVAVSSPGPTLTDTCRAAWRTVQVKATSSARTDMDAIAALRAAIGSFIGCAAYQYGRVHANSIDVARADWPTITEYIADQYVQALRRDAAAVAADLAAVLAQETACGAEP